MPDCCAAVLACKQRIPFSISGGVCTRAAIKLTKPATPAMTETFLRVEYREKDEVKRLGAYWSREHRQWYVPAGRDLTPFVRWLPVQDSPAAYRLDEVPELPVQGLSG